MINSIGLQNIGIEAILGTSRRLGDVDVPVIATSPARP